MFPRQGLKNLLDYLLAQPDMEITYRLFSNNYTPIVTSVIGDFTECTFPGYLPLDAVTEAAASITGSEEALSLGGDLVWTRDNDIGAAQDAYGMYVTFVGNDSAQKLLFAFRFTHRVHFLINGDTTTKKFDWYVKEYTP